MLRITILLTNFQLHLSLKRFFCTFFVHLWCNQFNLWFCEMFKEVDSIFGKKVCRNLNTSNEHTVWLRLQEGWLGKVNTAILFGMAFSKHVLHSICKMLRASPFYNRVNKCSTDTRYRRATSVLTLGQPKGRGLSGEPVCKVARTACGKKGREPLSLASLVAVLFRSPERNCWS